MVTTVRPRLPPEFTNLPSSNGHLNTPESRVGDIVLYNLDCAKGMTKLSSSSIDCIVTSPPYNLGISYNEYDDTLPRDRYISWLISVFKGLKTKLKLDGSLFLNIGSAPSSPWGPFEVISALRPYFVLQNSIHWIKSIYVENDSYGERKSLNVGHYKPINGNRFLNDTHEYIFHLTKTGRVPLDRLSIGVPYKDKGNIERWRNGSAGLRCRGNTWYVPYKTINSRERERPHPASFPIEIAEMCIKLHGIRLNPTTVLDPFMGIGNTALACRKLGVGCIGFEIDKSYYETSVKLLKQSLI
jgi:site-specific DNA-methyltransferase (adenine-specific)